MLLESRANARYAVGLARAGIGAMIFALPLTMTMEMWQFGVTVDPFRLAVTQLLSLPMLVALSFYAGFEPTFSLLDNVLDAFAAFVVSAVACAFILLLVGEIGAGTPFREVVGKLAVLSIPASIGALLADKQFNDRPDDQARNSSQASFGGRLFVMGLGALFLALNIAPTDEIEIIATRITPMQALLLAVVSFGLLLLIQRMADSDRPIREGLRAEHIARGLAGYGLCLCLSLYVLWFFGDTDATGFDEVLESAIVLSLPGALGAGAARLIFGGEAANGER